MRAARSVSQFGARLYSVRDNVKVGRQVHIGAGTTIWAPDQLVIDDNVYIGKRCTIEVNGRIGSGTLLANDVGLVGRNDHDFSKIGVLMRDAPWVGNHDMPSTGPEFTIEIGPDCWIGFGAIVLSGVTVGRGSIVSAGAIVVHDVAPYTIVAGCPARVVSHRFTPEQIVEHETKLGLRPGRE